MFSYKSISRDNGVFGIKEYTYHDEMVETAASGSEREKHTINPRVIPDPDSC